MNWSLGRPRALGVSWSEVEPREALGGLGPWERAGARCEPPGETFTT